MTRRPEAQIPPRWVRRAYAIAPVIGLSLVVVCGVLPLVGPHPDRSVSGVVWAVLTALFGIAVLAWVTPSVRAQFLIERRATARMTSDYQRLRELIDAHPDNPYLLGPDREVLLWPRSYRGRHGQAWEVLWLDRDEVATAMGTGIAAPVVCERFRLAGTAPVVWHEYDAMTVEHQRLRSGWGTPPASRWARWRSALRVARLSDRTGLDIASEDEVEGLISQLRYAQP